LVRIFDKLENVSLLWIAEMLKAKSSHTGLIRP